MACIIPFMKESPRWLATKHKNELALKNLAWIRKTPEDDLDTQAEFAEIVAAIEEEEAVIGGRSWKEAFAPGNRIRFFIAFVSPSPPRSFSSLILPQMIFLLQQFSGQK